MPEIEADAVNFGKEHYRKIAELREDPERTLARDMLELETSIACSVTRYTATYGNGGKKSSRVPSMRPGRPTSAGDIAGFLKIVAAL